ncbi:MAG: glycosyltransferase [Thiohalocapsa sp.]|nr:glycosyltransferase [Thiohalocapsa sp.]MCF7991478.1 glycosyltransferase [Thiohalocapsa sp.]
MRYCDLTLAYTETSGGIRTYIDAKRRYIAENSNDEHVLIVPGEADRISTEGRLVKMEIRSPLIPGCQPYRFFWRPAKVRHALEQAAPDVVELGSFFVSPWAAFRYREECRSVARSCLVSAYFHTDIAHAYVGAPLHKFLAEGAQEISDTLAQWGEKISGALESSAEETFGAIFRRCDLTFAATPVQAARIAEYGVQGTYVVPLGVDLSQFSPRRRTAAWREQLCVGDDDLLLVYCGRLDAEKAVHVLVDAYAALLGNADGPRFHLAIIGDGPLREELLQRARDLPRLHVLPYLRDRAAYARALASADIYVTAGAHETFGLAVVEAQASGLPVVGVAAGALTERVAEDRGRLGPVDDAAAMADNIRAVAHDRDRLGAAARAYVLSAGFSWTRSFEKLLTVYEEAMAAQRAHKR